MGLVRSLIDKVTDILKALKNLTMPYEITDAFTSQPIKVVVGRGDRQKLFFIHKKFFETKASIFNIILSGAIEEETENWLELPDVSSGTFEVFSEWLYWGTLTSLCDVRLVPSDLRWKILKTIIFADKYCLVELHDRALSILVHNHPGIISFHDLKLITTYVIDNAAPDCNIRPFLARMWAWYIHSHNETGDYLSGHPDLEPFACDTSFVAEVFSYVGPQEDIPFTEDFACDFHIHQALDTCPYECFDGLNGVSATVVHTPSDVAELGP
ncbi:hypothetical protein V494_00003 [Pseudogymnoascus sp. VKM F-4513 (FW-928)]|nr:hypothetical protein V494_00003 [Pseudogymnoascus sp. VKM F-4513 (FW-928)]